MSPRKVIPFPRKRPDRGLPGMTEAEQLVERLGPAGAVRVAEYILLEALWSVKTPTATPGRVRVPPEVLTGVSIDLMMAVRRVADLWELRANDREAFNAVERAYRAARRKRA